MILKVAPKAIEDIAEIKNFIRSEYNNLTAANRIAAKIKKSYKQLKITPNIGKRLDAAYNVKTDYYFLVCDNYLIFYTVDEETVSVDRVIHGKRDYCRMLFNLKLTDSLCDNEQE